MTDNAIIALINQRRRQILVHSCLYYRMDRNLIDDNTWSKWAMELYNLQMDYPELASQVPYSEAFDDFDYSTGCNLPLDDAWVVGTARHLLKICK